MMRVTAKRLPVQPGPAGWAELLPPRRPTAPLTQNITADVAVIGGGFAGLSAARHLAQLDPTLTIAVLEAGEIAHGPAGRNSGFMIDLPHDLSSDDYAGSGPEHDRQHIAHNRIAIDFARDVAQHSAMPQEVFDPCGKINAAATPAGDTHNTDFASYLATLGEPSTLLTAQDMHDLTGTRVYSSGLLTPGAVMIQPAAYIRGLADAIAPATLYEHSPVTALERVGQDWQLTTPKGTVTARKVILATNGHAESFGFHKRRLMHVFTYASMTRALTPSECQTLGGAPRWSVTPADPMGTTVRRITGTGGDRLIIRARFTYDPTMQVSPAKITRAGHLHDKKFRDRFPMLANVDMQYRWAGHLCLSWNGVPAFGELDTGLVSAVCQNGLGTVQGTLSGLAAAETTLAMPGPAAQAFGHAPPPRHLPPEPLAWLGANATMRWKEWRAGQE